MLFTSSLLAVAMQVGLNQPTIPPSDGHEELRNRPPREEAIDSPESQWLAECLALVAEDPARAHTLAQVKRNEAFGTEQVLANHCLGLAATELALWEDAITAFSAAREATPPEELSARARFAAMAGNAALASGDPARAFSLLTQAKQDAQIAASATLEAIAVTDLARAMVALGQGEDALAELERATVLTPQNPESWLLKATLLRRLERLDEAQASIERAGELAPFDPQVGLEAGVIAVLAGREDAARASWQSVIDLQADGPAASTAQAYLDQLGPQGTPQTP